MKKYLYAFLILLLIASCAAYAEGPVIDPTITPTATITCNYPVEREDGTALAVNEIAQINFFVSTDKLDWQPAGSNDAECKQVYDTTAIADGQYYYTMTAVDQAGRGSLYAANANPPEVVAFVVKRIAKPKHPTGATVTFSQ